MAKREKRKNLPTVSKFLPQTCVFYQTEIHGTEIVKRCIGSSKLFVLGKAKKDALLYKISFNKHGHVYDLLNI